MLNLHESLKVDINGWNNESRGILTAQKKNTIHQVTTLLATSKKSYMYFQVIAIC